MLLNYGTKHIQYQLANYCRTGKITDLPGVREDRLPHYHRLVNNGINNTLEQAYPLTKQLLAQNQWESAVTAFIQEHDNQTPFIWKLPYEFYGFVKEKKFSEAFDIPYLNDLLYFEWVEIEVHTMPDIQAGPYQEHGDLFDDTLVVNPGHELISLEYPVHLYPFDKIGENKGSYFILVFRTPEQGHVKFIDVSVLYAFIFEHLKFHPRPLLDIVNDAKSTFKLSSNKENLINAVKNFIKDLMAQKAILGFKDQL